ncbi:MAG TPA: aconitate hydratase AcnA [Polyangiales bacterium]|nr:aconitate hydratase AcnA [Polyangiales bacterium]
MTTSHDSFGSKATLDVGGRKLDIHRIDALARAGVAGVDTLPVSLRVLLENLLRNEDGGKTVSADDIAAVAGWDPKTKSAREIAYRPARVLLQDFTGVPVVADLAAMRDAYAALGGKAARINPLQPVDLVIDHSVQVDSAGMLRSFADNVRLEFERNGERYRFLKWGQGAFDGLRVVPPGTGIVHQVNLEYLAKVVFVSERDGRASAYPDTLVGTDSHTTMINGIGVLGWGVGGIEAEAAMLGQPVSMLVPEVVGFELKGQLKPGVTATDLVLTVVQMLRKKGVVEKFVEFYGDGLDRLSLPDRATIANMAPEYGATMGFFPVDDVALAYLRLTGRDEAQVALVERYCKEQGLFRGQTALRFTDTLSLELDTVEASLAGPSRPQDRIPLRESKASYQKVLPTLLGDKGDAKKKATLSLDGTSVELTHGAVVIAAITSCTNTSNPAVLLAAGLLAKKAVERGLTSKPWVKTSLAPGSQVVTDYLKKAGLLPSLESLGFHVVGYGCTTCIGNSGPIDNALADAIKSHDLVAAAVLSGNRNFEGRIHPLVRANYLASPPLVVAYALAGTMNIDLASEPLGQGSDGKPVFLKDVWPSQSEIDAAIAEHLKGEMFSERYGHVFEGPEDWQKVQVPTGSSFAWQPDSTYIRKPPFFEGVTRGTPPPPKDIAGARALAVVGDSVTTDHISPAGDIAQSGPAALYLKDHGVLPRDFNSYGSRRGNHEVMMRGTFANIRLKNLMLPGTEGGLTLYRNEKLPIYDAAMRHIADGTPTVVFGGEEYGTGSSRDWAAKGTNLLGVRAVITESFERIHRSNLVGMGIVPLQFADGVDRKTLKLDGTETFTIENVAGLRPRQDVTVHLTRADGTSEAFQTRCRIDTVNELEYFLHGGILQYVLRNLAA